MMVERILGAVGGEWDKERGWGNFVFTADLNKDRWKSIGQTITGMGMAMDSHLDLGVLSRWGVEFLVPGHRCQTGERVVWGRMGGLGVVEGSLVRIQEREVECEECGARLWAVPGNKNQNIVVLADGILETVKNGVCPVSTSKGVRPKVVGGLVWDESGKTVVGLFLGSPPVIQKLGHYEMDVIVKSARSDREETVRRVNNMVERWMCNDLVCQGPMGHVSCKMSYNLGTPDTLVRIAEVLEMEADLFADVFHRCKASSISRWYSEEGKWVWAGSSGDPLWTPWAGKKAWIFPPDTDEIWEQIVEKLRDEPADEKSLFLVVCTKQRRDRLSDLCFTRVASSTRPIMRTPDHLRRRESSLTRVGGTWDLWISSTKNVSPPQWMTVMDLLRGSDWQPTKWLVVRVNTIRKITKWMAELAETDRRKSAADKIQRSLSGLQAESNNQLSARKQDYLFGLLAREMSDRGKGADIEDLLELATSHLGPPESWGKSATGAKRLKKSSGYFPEFLKEPEETIMKWWTTFEEAKGLSIVGNLTDLHPEPLRPIVLCRVLDFPSWVKKENLPLRAGKIVDGFQFVITPPSPLPRWTIQTRVLIDIGGSDGLLEVIQGQQKSRWCCTMVGWSRFCVEAGVWSKTVNKLTIRRDPTIRDLLSKWSTMHPSVSGSVHPTPIVKPPEEISMWEATMPREGFPSVSEVVPSESVIKPKLTLSSDPETKKLFVDTIDQALAAGLSPSEALREGTDRACDSTAPIQRQKTIRDRLSNDKGYISVMGKILGHAKLRDRVALQATDSSSFTDKFPSTNRMIESILKGEEEWVRLVNRLEWAITESVRIEAMKEWTRKQDKKRKAQERCRKVYKFDKKKAYNEMTKGPIQAPALSLGRTIEDVRDKGRRSSLSVTELAIEAGLTGLPNLHTDPDDRQWSTTCIRRGFNMSMINTIPESGGSRPTPQPECFEASSLTEWAVNLSEEDYHTWTESATPSLEVGEFETVWSESDLDYHGISGRIENFLDRARADDMVFIEENGAAIIKVTDRSIIEELFQDLPRIDNQIPDLVSSTDGSGTGGLSMGEGGPGGFGSLLLMGGEVFVVLGGKDCTTPGEMELAAWAESARWCSESGANSALFLGDYLNWVQKDLDVGIITSFEGSKKKELWADAANSFLRWKMAGGDSLWRVHTKSHIGGQGHWGNQLNEIVDIIADIGKTWRSEGFIPEWNLRNREGETDSIASLGLTRPLSIAEVATSMKERESKASDTEGRTTQLLTETGPKFLKKLTEMINQELFRGGFYSDLPSVWGRHTSIGKETGGVRNLLIPDCLGIILPSVMSKRLNTCLMEGKSVSKSQKCNIKGVSGSDENVFVFLMLLFEFHNAAYKGRLRDGQVRVFFLDDLRFAFDRVQYQVLLHAIKVVVKTDDPERFLLLVLSMSEKVRVVVSVNGEAAIVGKDGGVPQGNPLSSLLFLIVVEYCRRTIDPAARPPIKIRARMTTHELVVEMDFADDGNRTADSVVEAQLMIDALIMAFMACGLSMNQAKLKVLAIRYTMTGGVEVFDPRLTTLTPEGRKVIEAFTSDSWFKISGVITNFRGEFIESGVKAISRDTPIIRQISRSEYPIRAKLDALRTVADKCSEFLWNNAWVDQSVVTHLDTLERKSIRSFFGINLPNVYIHGEMKLAMRTDRQQILYLTSFIKRLCSTVPEVKLLALLAVDEGPALTDTLLRPIGDGPSFFGWPLIPRADPGEGIIQVGGRIAWLASKWGVGLESVRDKLEIRHWKETEGVASSRPIPNPRDLLKILSSKAESAWVERLENRVSTDGRKVKPGPFSISWGDAGRVSKNRKDESGFLKHGGYSDQEVRTLTGLRLLLWPTAFRRSVIAGNTTPGICKCGAIQTASHFLNVREYSTSHSEALRAIPNVRHAAWVKTLGEWFESNTQGWKVVLGETVTPSVEFEGTRTRLREAIASRAWAGDRFGSKPDLVVAKGGGPDPLIFRVLDVCGGSPDKLIWEDDLKDHLDKMNHLDPSIFEAKGDTECFSLTAKGLSMIPPELKKKAAAITSFKRVRYRRRYDRYCDLLVSLHLQEKPKASVSPVALAVSGLIPDSTTSLLDEFASKKEVRELCKKLRLVSWSSAVKAYNAWRAEE